MTQIGRSSIVSTTTQLSPGGNSSYSLILALRCLVPCRSVCCHIRLGRRMCVLTRQIYLAVKCWNKFSMGGIFHWTYLSFSLFFSLFSPFLYPFLFFSLFLSLSLAISGCLFNLIRIHLIPDYFYSRDRSLFIVGGKALENFVCVTIKVTWSSISLCYIIKRPTHPTPPPSLLAINW